MKKILLGDELLIVFALIGDVTYGIDIHNVVSILETKNIRIVPLAPKHLNSILNYQGQIVTIFDLKTYFNSEKSASSEEKKIIYLKYKELHIGILVDKIIRIDYVSPSCIESLPEDQIENVNIEFCQKLFVIDENSPGIYWLNIESIKEFVNQIDIH